MTLRAFFAFAGIVTAIPPVWFLILFRPPGGMLPYSPRLEYVLHPLRQIFNRFGDHWNSLRLTVCWLPVISIWQPYPPTKDWWMGALLRLAAIANFGAGSRLFVVNFANSGTPIQFHSLWDAAYATSTICLQAVFSILLIWVYLTRRNWEA